jgi:hypothetical protein
LHAASSCFDWRAEPAGAPCPSELALGDPQVVDFTCAWLRNSRATFCDTRRAMLTAKRRMFAAPSARLLGHSDALHLLSGIVGCPA